jgi:hypothetical protein
MRFYFTEEDLSTSVRARDIRAALVHARHEVMHGRLGDPAPAGTDVWMHGLAIEGSPPMAKHIAAELVASPAAIAVFQLCDGDNMSFERIPADVTSRARLFLRNHWPRDRSRVLETFHPRMGWLPPMLKPMAPRPGKPLAKRAAGAVFYGTRTGFANMAGGKNAREEVVRLMRGSDLAFQGGILPHSDVRYPVPTNLLVQPLSERAHAQLINNAKICLAPWGNHPITYRFFEGLASRCLTIAQSIHATTFLDGGLQAGTHYVEVAPDLSDLTPIVRHYLANLDEAQRIADAGHDHFTRYFAARGKLISSYLFETTVQSWGPLYRASDTRNVVALSRSLAARAFPGRF